MRSGFPSTPPMRHRSPTPTGRDRLRQYVGDADLLVGFGPRLDDPTTDRYQLTEHARRVVLVSQSAEELCLGPAPALGIHCSLASAGHTLASSELSMSPQREEWVA